MAFHSLKWVVLEAWRRFVDDPASLHNPRSKIIEYHPGATYQVPDNTRDGFMALQRRQHLLECHYCGRRSNLRQDGTVKQWECKNCDAMNYLDENGEIADPPVAHTSSYEQQNTNQVQYAQAPRRPGPSLAHSAPEDPLFCADCLRNQQLFTTSLAQYLPDDSDPDYEALYKNYYKFRRNLEKRYPQICADCEPRVTARMRQAGYTAKSDCLRRLLDKSKKKRIPGPSYKFSWASLFDFLGLLLWTSGLLIQILWNVFGFLGSHTAAILASFVPQSDFLVVIPYLRLALVVPPPVLHFCSLILPYVYSVSGAPSLAKTGLVMSLVSLWWNPEYKNSVRGFNQHISGYLEWYNMQLLCIAVRACFWFVMGKGWFGSPDTWSAWAAHGCMVLTTLLTSFVAYRSIHVDRSRLFVQTPEKLKRYVQPKPKISADEIAANTAQLFSTSQGTPRNHVPLFPQKTTSPPGKRNIDFNVRPPKLDSYIKELNSKQHSNNSQQKSFQPVLTRSFSGSFSSSQDAAQSSPQAIKDRSQLLALEKTLQPDFGALAVRESPPNPRPQRPPNDEDMDWEPIISPPRAFQKDPAAANRGPSFGSTPVTAEQKGAFWYHVPPAPRSQNSKLRNPTRPAFAAPSDERKENFFQSMSGNKPAAFGAPNTRETIDTAPRHEMNMAQPKFFPKPTDSSKEADDGLSEMMNQSFSLKEKVESEVQREEEEKGRRWWHLLVVLVVLLSLGLYLYFSAPSAEELYQEMLALSRGVRHGDVAADSTEDTRAPNSDYRGGGRMVGW